MNTTMYASKFNQVSRRMELNGTLKLNANVTSQQWVYQFIHLDKFDKSWKTEKKLRQANVMKSDELNEQLQRKVQRKKF